MTASVASHVEQLIAGASLRATFDARILQPARRASVPWRGTTLTLTLAMHRPDPFHLAGGSPYARWTSLRLEVPLARRLRRASLLPRTRLQKRLFGAPLLDDDFDELVRASGHVSGEIGRAIALAREPIEHLFEAAAGHRVWIRWSWRRLSSFIHVPPHRADVAEAQVDAMAALACVK